MREEIISRLEELVGSRWVVTQRDILEGYMRDETAEDVSPEPSRDIVVVKPRTSLEVSEILRLANAERVPVFPRGGGTGLVGGAVPTKSGIVLSLERMDSIGIDRENLMAEVEAGVTLGRLIAEADSAGLFFPPHPGDEGAHIGGLIACNAGGARALKTGVIRNYVRGLEVVLPTGEILNLGGKLLKNNAGYDLMHIFIGSEGTLGVITKAILRLYPAYRASATLLVPFNDRLSAIKAVPRILQSGVMPLALEFVERELVVRTAERLGLRWPSQEGGAYLIIIVADVSEDVLYPQLERLAEVCSEAGSLEPLIAESRREQEDILKIRSSIYEVLKPDTVDILDVTVPPARIGELLERINDIAKKYGTYIPVYGHAGDGNLHPHIMRGDGRSQYRRIRDEIYAATAELGGTITGEHGIGAIRTESLERFLGGDVIALMRRLKRLLDPNNILNPGKVVEVR